MDTKPAGTAKPTDKLELRARVAERKSRLERELARIQTGAPAGTATVEPHAIESQLASLASLTANTEVISEITATELSRWLDATATGNATYLSELGICIKSNTDMTIASRHSFVPRNLSAATPSSCTAFRS